MDKITIEAPAKVNLTLDVIGKRADGYHELETIMHPISLIDKITIEKASSIIVNSNSSLLPNDKSNLAYQAAELFFQKIGKKAGVKIFIEKNIPIGAGLAGGSTNAAAVLLGLNNLYQANLREKELWELACQLGSDVPFCLLNTTALAKGRGELLTPVESRLKLDFLLVKPSFSVVTKDIFSQFNLTKVKLNPDNMAFINAWHNQDIQSLALEMVNVLETVTIEKYPEIGTIKLKMQELGAINAIMSGSGPSVLGLFTNLDKLENAYIYFKKSYPETFRVSSYFRSE